MNKLKSFFFRLNTPDLIVILFYLILTILNIVFFQRITFWKTLAAANLLIITFVFFISEIDNGKNKIIKAVHNWYAVPLIFGTFKELYYMVYPIHGRDYDELLIAADRFIFGTDPTHVLYSISNPFLTEFLQVVYSSFYFLPIILGIDLLLNNRHRAFEFSVFAVIYGFFLSYIGYLFLPAIGPRFTLHNFETTNIELPGLFLTNFLRETINAGESIPSGTINPASVVQRDVFPSGHTQMTLIVMYLSVKLKTKSRYFFLITGTLLIFATVYLRYHYFVDLIGGTVFMVLTMWSGNIIYKKWKRIKSSYNG